MNFLRNLLASILGSLIAFGILCFMMLLFFLILASAGGNEEHGIKISRGSVLKLSLTEPLEDYGGKYYFADVTYHFEKYNGLNHILRAIEAAADDDNIEGISIEGNFPSAGIAQLKAIRDALDGFKKSGKFVYAYGDLYLQKEYYVASIADSVFLNPVGELDFRGLVSEVLFFKDFQEKSGIRIDVVRHGKYKSAVEPFLENEMSEANRQQLSELLQSLWSGVLSDIGNSRKTGIEELQHIADVLAAKTAQGALENNLIDRIAYRDVYETALKNALGKSQTDKLEYVGMPEYAEHVAKKSTSFGKDNIAVIYAQGDIFYGEGTDEMVGQGIMRKALQEAREDEQVKAIVLRINSPGGSALASDLIWREVEITKAVKPVVVSMGNVAASGGYYIACGADRIFAEPGTITGSIGVFGMFPNVKELAARWGINAEQVTTNSQSLGYSLFEPLSDTRRIEATQGIETIYQTFLERVSEGRDMTVEAVNEIAQGRVWSGTEAQKIGLVDELGGLDAAVAYAAEKAGTSAYSIESYPVYELSFREAFDRFLGISTAERKEQILQSEIGREAYQILKKIRLLTQQKGAQARLPFELTIH